jgi:SHS family lactate transporter-like MFS transporter
MGTGVSGQSQPAGIMRELSKVSRVQWNAFFASWSGWLLDGFDFTILSFLLIDVQRSFTISGALAGALGTVTLMFRLLGGVVGGSAADRVGRKRPLMWAILWISLFSLLSGFSTSYAMLFAFRALFGIGMGGLWAAAMPLTLEHWPKQLRGVVSGLLMGGFNWGFMLAAVVFQLIYPVVSLHHLPAWRVLFYISAVPAVFIFWIRSQVKESPVWLARRETGGAQEQKKLSIAVIFGKDLLGTTIHTSLLMAAFLFSYYSINFWYPTFLREAHIAPLRFLILLNIGGVVGTVAWGRLSETLLGRRGAISLAAIGGVLATPFFLALRHPTALMCGAFLMGACAVGALGVTPSYLAERFPTGVRGVGPSFAYHAGAFIASFTPAFIGLLQDRGAGLRSSMAGCIALAGLLMLIVVRMGPETRGLDFGAIDC